MKIEQIAILRCYWMQLGPDGPELSLRSMFSCYAGLSALLDKPNLLLICATGRLFGDKYPAVSELVEKELLRLKAPKERVRILTTPYDSYTETLEARRYIAKKFPDFSGEYIDIGFNEHERTSVDYVYPALNLDPPTVLTFEDIFKNGSHIPPGVQMAFQDFKNSWFEKYFWVWENGVKRPIYKIYGVERMSKRNSHTRRHPMPNSFLPIDSWNYLHE